MLEGKALGEPGRAPEETQGPDGEERQSGAAGGGWARPAEAEGPQAEREGGQPAAEWRPGHVGPPRGMRHEMVGQLQGRKAAGQARGAFEAKEQRGRQPKRWRRPRCCPIRMGAEETRGEGGVPFPWEEEGQQRHGQRHRTRRGSREGHGNAATTAHLKIQIGGGKKRSLGRRARQRGASGQEAR